MEFFFSFDLELKWRPVTRYSVGSVAAKTVDLDASNTSFLPSSLKNILKNGIMIFMGPGNSCPLGGLPWNFPFLSQCAQPLLGRVRGFNQ